MTWLLVGIALVVGLFVIDRVLLACERRGWLYYRRAPRPWGTGLGNAMQQMDVFFQPAKRHVIEPRVDQELQREQDDDGGSDRPGSSRR
jgi:hypothetical protein